MHISDINWRNEEENERELPGSLASSVCRHASEARDVLQFYFILFLTEVFKRQWQFPTQAARGKHPHPASLKTQPAEPVLTLDPDVYMTPGDYAVFGSERSW